MKVRQSRVWDSAPLPCHVHRGYQVVTTVDCKALAEVTGCDAFASFLPAFEFCAVTDLEALTGVSG